MRIRTLLLVAPVLLLGACVDQPTLVPPPEPEPELPPPPLGIYRFTLTGIGTPEMSATAEPIPYDGPNAALTMVSAGLGFELSSVNTFTEGLRTAGHDGQRYVSFTYRVRNSTGSPVSNVTLVPVASASTIGETPFLQIRRFDLSNADPAIAPRIVPTGAVAIGEDGRMRATYPDVLQAYEEAEVAGISHLTGKSAFPFGFVVRSTGTSGAPGRTLAPTGNPNDFGGTLTFAFRLPLQPSASADPFSITFDAVAVQDSEVRMTESIEEAQDTAAVRRLRTRRTELGATVVTVLNGSPRTVSTPYPGQRQLCSVRTAGTVATPVTFITERGALADYRIFRPGESLDSCAADFKTGSPGRPATNVPFDVTVRAMDRYGNVKTVVDTVQLVVEPGSPPVALSAPTALSSGSAVMSMTFSDYGTATSSARGKRLRGTETPITVAGVTRIWTAGAGTVDWHTGGNWQGGAVPMSLDSVLVPTTPSGGAIFPQLAANVPIMGVTVENGATINLSAFDLTAGANVTTGTSGGISSTSGRLVLAGVGRTFHGLVPRLRVTGTYSLTGNVTTRAPVEVPLGRITNTSFRIQATSF